jgi:5-(carboxyamino)imidazole ribonucleotide mutase
LSPRVGIRVGGDDDFPALERCTARLKGYGIEYEVEVRDVHANPESASGYAGPARERALKVIICAAGMSAHLAGAVAARTTLPVVGIPVGTGTLGGFDTLLAARRLRTTSTLEHLGHRILLRAVLAPTTLLGTAYLWARLSSGVTVGARIFAALGFFVAGYGVLIDAPTLPSQRRGALVASAGASV